MLLNSSLSVGNRFINSRGLAAQHRAVVVRLALIDNRIPGQLVPINLSGLGVSIKRIGPGGKLDGFGVNAFFAHQVRGFWYRERVADAPVGGAVHNNRSEERRVG